LHPTQVLGHTQFVRYSALLGDVSYGIAHRRTLQCVADAAKVIHAACDREHLVARAKEAWAAKQASRHSYGCTSDFIFMAEGPRADGSDHKPDHPKFDIEKLVAKWEKDLAQTAPASLSVTICNTACSLCMSHGLATRFKRPSGCTVVTATPRRANI
jgi:F-type H+-transporting ATP synthase subunit e